MWPTPWHGHCSGPNRLDFVGFLFDPRCIFVWCKFDVRWSFIGSLLAAYRRCMGCSLDLHWIVVGWPSAFIGSSLELRWIYFGHALDSHLELCWSFVGFSLDFAAFHWMLAGSRRTSSDFRWIVMWWWGGAGRAGSGVALVCGSRIGMGSFHTIRFKKQQMQSIHMQRDVSCSINALNI